MEVDSDIVTLENKGIGKRLSFMYSYFVLLIDTQSFG